MPATTPYAAVAPDVIISFSLSQASAGTDAGLHTLPLQNPPAPGTSQIIDNRLLGCTDWVFTYNTFGYSAITLRFQDAPNASDGTIGTWENYAGSTNGTNPGTSTTQGVVYGTGNPYPFLRINLTAATGTGTVTGTLFGYRRGAQTLNTTLGNQNVNINTIFGTNVVNGGTAGTLGVGGTLTNNNAAPSTNNLGALTALANAANPTWTEGDQVLLSSDLTGAIRVGGAVPSGTALASSGGIVVVGLSDGGNIFRLRGDSNGRTIPAGTNVTPADAVSNTSMQIPNVGAAGMFWTPSIPFTFNGTGWDRWRSASLSNNTLATTLTARNVVGTPIVEKGSRWTVVSAPAANSTASASIAAEGSVRHVVDTISWSASSSGAVTAANTTLVIRDGATGAGTIIWQGSIAIGVAAGAGIQCIPPNSVTGLNLVGSTNTAMTCEFGAGATNLTQAITMTGYNIA